MTIQEIAKRISALEEQEKKEHQKRLEQEKREQEEKERQARLEQEKKEQERRKPQEKLERERREQQERLERERREQERRRQQERLEQERREQERRRQLERQRRPQNRINIKRTIFAFFIYPFLFEIFRNLLPYDAESGGITGIIALVAPLIIIGRFTSLPISIFVFVAWFIIVTLFH